ncbi:MAG: HAD family phosphatase [Candidatus Paceibacterota bacterium]
MEKGKFIRGVAFDLEGTVVNLEPIHHQSHILSAQDVGLRLTLDDCFERLPHFIGGPDEKVAEEIAHEVGATNPDVASRILESKRAHYERLFRDFSFTTRPGFFEIFGWLRAHNLGVAIGTATPFSRIRPILDRSGLSMLFTKKEIITEIDVKHNKPAPDIFLETAKRMGVNPDQQLVFEDSPRGVMAGIAAGSLVVGMPIYKKASVLQALLEAGVSRIFMEWNEIEIAALIINLSSEPQRTQ